MRILFCDDDSDILIQLQDYVAEYFAHIGGFLPEYEAYTSGELLLENEKVQISSFWMWRFRGLVASM